MLTNSKFTGWRASIERDVRQSTNPDTNNDLYRSIECACSRRNMPIHGVKCALRTWTDCRRSWCQCST
jgi:hypothetical protein